MLESIYKVLQSSIEKGLEFSALILSIINALILIWYFLRDKPKLVVDPIHPDIYQWWFKLPDGEHEGEPTRRFGFLVYVGIRNQGLRKVSLKKWRLKLRSNQFFKKYELKPHNLLEPRKLFGENFKLWPVLGQKGEFSDGSTLIESGVSISGMVYFVAEIYGHENYDPVIKNDEIKGKFYVEDVFDNSTSCKIEMKKKSWDEIKEISPGIEDFN